jgi:hypothetical protein
MAEKLPDARIAEITHMIDGETGHPPGAIRGWSERVIPNQRC